MIFGRASYCIFICFTKFLKLGHLKAPYNFKNWAWVVIHKTFYGLCTSIIMHFLCSTNFWSLSHPKSPIQFQKLGMGSNLQNFLQSLYKHRNAFFYVQLTFLSLSHTISKTGYGWQFTKLLTIFV